MTIADRIHQLRKKRGISQEELADQIGVSRQAVSKWESSQSLPDLEKILLLSDYFHVTTDYLLKGTEPEPVETKADARIFTLVGSILNFIGLMAAILIWKEEQRPSSVFVGLIVMAVGCMVFAIGQLMGENRKAAAFYFQTVNVWFLSLMPISCIFNGMQGVLAGTWWSLSPLPSMGNSLFLYGMCWLVYAAFCILADIFLAVRRKP